MKPKNTSALLAILFLLLSCALAWSATPVRVVGVSDGDTIRVVVGGKETKVRLHGIDAPENGQAYGNVATAIFAEAGATPADAVSDVASRISARILRADSVALGEAIFGSVTSR